MAEETIEMGQITAEMTTTDHPTPTGPKFHRAISHLDSTSLLACRIFRQMATLLTIEAREETDVVLLGNLAVDGNRLPIRLNERSSQERC